MYPSVYCITCKTNIPNDPDHSDVLAKHVVLKNHILYYDREPSKRTEKEMCCEFCLNRNMLLLGYSTRMKRYLCINCIANKSYFTAFLDWKDTYVSWYPLALSSEIISCLRENPIPKPTDSPRSPRMFAVMMNGDALHKISEYVSCNESEAIDAHYSVLGYGDFSTCVRVNIPDIQNHGEILPTCCCEINFKDGPQHVDAVVVMCNSDNVVITLRNLDVESIDQNGICSVLFSTRGWCNPTIFTTCGFLIQRHVIDSYLLNRWMGYGVNQLYRQVHMSSFKGLSLGSTEQNNLSFVVKNILSIVECGENADQQIEYAAMTGISINNCRKCRVVFLSTNEQMLDMVTNFINIYFNKFNKTYRKVYCVRACSDTYHPSILDINMACFHSFFKECRSTNSRDILNHNCKIQYEKVGVLKSHEFVAVSISEIPLITRLPQCCYICLDAEYISNARLAGLIPYATQMILFCRNQKFEAKNVTADGISGLATSYLVDHHTPVVSIHKPLITLYDSAQLQERNESKFEPVNSSDYVDLPLTAESNSTLPPEKTSDKKDKKRKKHNHSKSSKKENSSPQPIEAPKSTAEKPEELVKKDEVSKEAHSTVQNSSNHTEKKSGHRKRKSANTPKNEASAKEEKPLKNDGGEKVVVPTTQNETKKAQEGDAKNASTDPKADKVVIEAKPRRNGRDQKRRENRRARDKKDNASREQISSGPAEKKEKEVQKEKIIEEGASEVESKVAPKRLEKSSADVSVVLEKKEEKETDDRKVVNEESKEDKIEKKEVVKEVVNRESKMEKEDKSEKEDVDMVEEKADNVVVNEGITEKQKEVVKEETEAVTETEEKKEEDEVANEGISEEKNKVEEEVINEAVTETEEKKEVELKVVNEDVTEEKGEEVVNEDIPEEKKEEVVNEDIPEEKKEEVVNEDIPEEKKEEVVNEDVTEEKKEEVVNEDVTEEKEENTAVSELMNEVINEIEEKVKTEVVNDLMNEIEEKIDNLVVNEVLGEVEKRKAETMNEDIPEEKKETIIYDAEMENKVEKEENIEKNGKASSEVGEVETETTPIDASEAKEASPPKGYIPAICNDSTQAVFNPPSPITQPNPGQTDSDIYHEIKQYDDESLMSPELSSEAGFAEKEFDLPSVTTEISPIQIPNVVPSYVIKPPQNPSPDKTPSVTDLPNPAETVPPPAEPTAPPKKSDNPLMLPYIPGFPHM